ncbi:MAG: FAD:protein FMN transferase [Bacteroidota bacterium]
MQHVAGPPAQIRGETMGTYYAVTFPEEQGDSALLLAGVDSTLIALNASLSTYIPEALISQLNASVDTAEVFVLDEHFARVWERSVKIHAATDGAFNPALGPLITAWGFGPDLEQRKGEVNVDSLLPLTRLDAFVYTPASGSDPATMRKKRAGATLDFSAIAKGYGVDLVGGYLQSQGVTDYFVDIGGEVVTRGEHPEGRPWRVGIERPSPDERAVQRVLDLGDAALASSGNYRNFYVVDGRRIVHTINPETGLPETSNLLGVSVTAPDCMTADAYATAFMVMGYERARALVEQDSVLDALFILGGEEEGAYEERGTLGSEEVEP